jgi:hypothetical protein
MAPSGRGENVIEEGLAMKYLYEEMTWAATDAAPPAARRHGAVS